MGSDFVSLHLIITHYWVKTSPNTLLNAHSFSQRQALFSVLYAHQALLLPGSLDGSSASFMGWSAFCWILREPSFQYFVLNCQSHWSVWTLRSLSLNQGSPPSLCYGLDTLSSQWSQTIIGLIPMVYHFPGMTVHVARCSLFWKPLFQAIFMYLHMYSMHVFQTVHCERISLGWILPFRL